MRALITGVAGFAGGHLAEYLAQATDWELTGVVRPRARLDPAWAARLGLRVVEADLRRFDETSQALAAVQPDFVFHLAAQPIVEHALADPEATLVNNLTAQLNVLRGVQVLDRPARLLAVGS